jgi:hypothetical protein
MANGSLAMPPSALATDAKHLTGAIFFRPESTLAQSLEKICHPQGVGYDGRTVSVPKISPFHPGIVSNTHFLNIRAKSDYRGSPWVALNGYQQPGASQLPLIDFHCSIASPF